MNQLADLRRRLAEARITLRQAKDAETSSRAIAETGAIERLNGNAGKNEAERARNLTIALLNDDTYSAVLVLLRSCEAEVDRLNAEIAIEEDAVRLNEARIREKLADALMNQTTDHAVIDRARATRW